MAGTISNQQAVKNASVLCSKSEKCSYDIIALFKKWDLSEEEITKGLDYLIKEKFIDDARFSQNFVHDKFRLNKWGKVKIAYMLRMRRIPESIIAESLSSMPDEDYEQTIRDLLRSKLKSVKGATKHEIKGKLAAFAQGRGFESEIAWRMAGEIILSKSD